MNRAIYESPHITRSPQPLRSPSPDFVAANIITSTRTPTAQLSSLLNTRSRKFDVPLLDEIAQLKQQNEELKSQLTRQMANQGRPSLPVTGSRDQQAGKLFEELRLKELEIDTLKQTISNSASKVSGSSKKLSLTANDAAHMRELSDRIKQLNTENNQLREKLRQMSAPQVGSSSDEVKLLKKRLREVEADNENLLREIRRKESVHLKPEPADMDSERVKLELRRIREDVMRQIDRLFQQTNDKLSEMDKKLYELMAKQSMLIAQTRIKKGDQGSTANSRPVDKPLTGSHHSGYQTPNKHIVTTTSQYVWNPMGGSATGNTQSIPQPTQLDTIISNQNLTISKLQNELNKVSEQVDRFTRQNHSIKDQNNYLTNELSRLRNQPLTGYSDSMVSSDLTETIRRLEKQNRELNNSVNSNMYAIDQQGRERILKDNQVNELNRIIKDLNHKIDYIQTEKNQQIMRLQSQNRLYKQSVESLNRSHMELTSQLERARASNNTGNSQFTAMTTYNNDPHLLKQINQLKADNQRLLAERQQNSTIYNNDPELLREIGQLKSDIQRLRNEKLQQTQSVIRTYNNDPQLQKQHQQKVQIMRLRTENSLLTKERAYAEQITRSHQKEESRLLTVNSELTRQLNHALEDLRKEKELVVSLQTQIASLRNLLDRMNNDLQQLNPLKANAEHFRSESNRLQRIVEQSDKSIAILKGQKENVIRQAEDYVKLVEQLRAKIRSKDQQIIHILETRKSPAIDAYLRDLTDLKRELQTLNLQPLQLEIHDKNQRLKTLLSQKLMTSRLVNKHIQDIEVLLRQNDRLRKQTLDAESRFISMKEQNEKLRSFIESKQHERISMERQIGQLKGIIMEYINKELVYQQGALTAETQKQIRLMEEQINFTQIRQQKSLHDITSLKTNFEHAIRKLDSISNKIRDELNRPPQKITTHIIQ